MWCTLLKTLSVMADKAVFVGVIFMLLGSVILSFKLRFVQIRMIPNMIRLFFGYDQQTASSAHMVQARRALFTAMSTTIGMGNIVAPVFAIGCGGPGALLGFVLGTFFGGASVYSEILFSLMYRKRYADGSISGGPMQYLSIALHPFFSFLYAALGVILLASWSASQANQLAVLLEPWHISRSAAGIGCIIFVISILIGGVKRIGEVTTRLVPIMFVIYSAAMLWILFLNISKIPSVIRLIFACAFSQKGYVGVGVGFGLQKALRWGLAKSVQANEAGLGTSGIAHAAANTDKPVDQAVLGLVSVYTNGFLCLLSGLAVLLTGVWQTPGLSFDIAMMYHVFQNYFPVVGSIILTISGLLFAVTTVLGNSFYGTQCFLFTTKNRFVALHYLLIAFFIYWGAVSDVQVAWSIVDIFMIPVAIPHIIGIVILTYRKNHVIRSS